MADHAPWASGPAEILRHGLELLRQDSDTHRRLAMISIDNAVELTIKTYLGLPQRITGLKISRTEYQDFSESFPKLLDALEKYAVFKLEGLNLGEIEWYHRLRNQLYHQGNGLTVERDKVEVYAELANILFVNLFGLRLVEPQEDANAQLGQFMAAWMDFEQVLSQAAIALGIDPRVGRKSPLDAMNALACTGVLSRDELNGLTEIRQLRNQVVHGQINHAEVLSPAIINRLKGATNTIRDKFADGR